MDPQFYFWVGVALGALAGGVICFVYVNVKNWFAGPEIKRLRQENRRLRERLAEKDKHVAEMMKQSEKIAAGVAELTKRR